MEKVFERKNGDTHIGLVYNLDKWALPFDISWWKYKDSVNDDTVSCTCFGLYLDFLCFRLHIEWWKYIGEKV